MKPERTKRSPRDDTARAAADRQAREIERLQRENDRLREQLDEQAKRIADLERQLAHHAHVFTFVHEEAVAPTNNVAERALRTAVQWRKIMFGNRRAEGERAGARLLTVTRTCQLQQLHVLAYLTAAIHSHRRRQPVASLLPKRLTP